MILLQEITLKFAKVQFFDTRLIRLEIFGNQVIGKSEAGEIVEAIDVLSKGSERYLLIVANELSQFTREAIDYALTEESLGCILADALVVRSLTQRITANIYLKLNKPKKPSKIFNNEKDATRWLYSLKEEMIPVW